MDSETIRTIASEETAKGAALARLFRAIGAPPEQFRRIPDYIAAGGGIEVVAYEAACQSLAETWQNTFAPPPPGTIRAEARRYNDKTRAEIRYQQEQERLERLRENRMTPEKIRAELDDPQHVDPDPAVERRRLASLNRILDAVGSREREERTQVGGAGAARQDRGLQRITDVYADIL